jgi:predicted PurR-regulated permease PerM
MLNQIHPNKIRQLFFLSVIILLFIVISKELYSILSAFLGAITLYALLRNVMIQLVSKYNLKKWLAALLLIISTSIVIILPSIWIVSISFEKLQPIINNPTLLNQTFEKIHLYLIQKVNIDILNADNIAKINAFVLGNAKIIIGGTMSTLGNIFIMFFVLYFMLVQTLEIETWLRKNVPFNNSNVNKILNESRNLIVSNAIGVPIVAILQGITGLLGYFIFGVQDFLFFGILTSICSIIPVVGSMIIWMPIMLFQLSIGNTWQGIAIGLWGFLLIGSVDNVARFVLQKKMANVHPLITIFGVFIGINIFGFLGIIFGPILFSIFFLLVKIYIDEFGKSSYDEKLESD